jgi:hypothetical protein
MTGKLNSQKHQHAQRTGHAQPNHLSAMPLPSRVPAPGPFTVLGSVLA